MSDKDKIYKFNKVLLNIAPLGNKSAFCNYLDELGIKYEKSTRLFIGYYIDENDFNLLRLTEQQYRYGKVLNNNNTYWVKDYYGVDYE